MGNVCFPGRQYRHLHNQDEIHLRINSPSVYTTSSKYLVEPVRSHIEQPSNIFKNITKKLFCVNRSF